MNNGDSEIKTVAVYTRVSTEEQAKSGLSLDNQLEKLQYFCKSKGWDVVGEYVDDGYSGRNIRRPRYTIMMQEMDQWDALVIYKMDRIHRNSMNFTKMMVNLNKNNKEFVSMSESYDTSNVMGRFLMDFVQRLAQLESELIGERVTVAMIQKAKDFKAGFVGHRLAFGYKSVRKIKNDEEVTEIHVVPDELEIVKEIFKLYSNGNTIPKIQKTLDLKYGRVRYPLTNIWYIGYEQWGNHFKLLPMDPAISLDLWNIVQTKRCKKSKQSNGEGCPCGSSNITKAGHRGDKQRYKCKECGRKFVKDPFKKGISKPFILEERVDSFTLSDKEMDEFGLWNHRIKNKVGG